MTASLGVPRLANRFSAIGRALSGRAASVALAVFAILEWLPGNAAQVILGETATPESIQALDAAMKADKRILSAQ